MPRLAYLFDDAVTEDRTDYSRLEGDSYFLTIMDEYLLYRDAEVRTHYFEPLLLRWVSKRHHLSTLRHYSSVDQMRQARSLSRGAYFNVLIDDFLQLGFLQREELFAALMDGELDSEESADDNFDQGDNQSFRAMTIDLFKPTLA